MMYEHLLCWKQHHKKTDVPTMPTGATSFCDKDEPVLSNMPVIEVQDEICFLREVKI